MRLFLLLALLAGPAQAADGSQEEADHLFALLVRRQRPSVFVDSNPSRAICQTRFGADGRRLMTASHDRVHVWDVPAMTPVIEPIPQQHPIEVADLSVDGKLLLTADGSRTLRLREVGVERPRWELRSESGFASATFSPDGTRVLLVRKGGQVAELRDATNGEPLLEVTDRTTYWFDGRQQSFPLEVAAFGPAGKTFLTSGGARPQVWSALTGELIATLGTPGASQIAFSPDGERIVYNVTALVRVSDARTGKRLGQTDGEIRADSQVANIRTVAFSPDGRTFATAVEGNARVWDAATCKPLTGPLASSAAGSLSYSPCSRWLATGSDWDAVAVWEVATGRRIVTIPDTTRSAYDPVVAFSPAGRHLAVNFGDTVELWEYGE